jgi:hypothetical protein
MANYLTCEHCHAKNAITSERLVFCRHCNKKLPNNYSDWRKAKVDASFDTYLNDIAQQTEKEEELFRKKEMITVKRERRSLVRAFLKNREAKILTAFTLCSVLLAFIFTSENGRSVYAASNSAPKSLTQDFLQQVKWGSYTVSNDLKLTIPFELKESESIMPYYAQQYTQGFKSKKTDVSNSFSVTVEEIELGDMHINENFFTELKDSWMNDINTSFVEKPVTEHMNIKGYKTQLAYGSYDLNGQRYNYENYTLFGDKKTVKIIISYLKNDQLLNKYADIVSKSIYANKALI